jgi:eukaryotic-like serine/threonine-protein kinase
LTGGCPDVADLLAEPRADTVGAHLDGCAKCRVLVKLLARATDDRALVPPRFAPELLALTEAFRRRIPERFEVGPGTPWLRNTPGRPMVRAFDRQRNRRVALAIAPDLQDPDRAAERLRQLARIDEPGFERVDDVIVHGGTLLYTAEVVEGPDLVELEPPDEPEPLHIARCVAPALVALHQRGLAHGNVQDASIRVAPRGRIVLVEPQLVAGPDTTPVGDWRRLGELLRRRVERSDDVLDAFADALVDGKLDGLGVLRRLLGLHGEGASGRRYQRLGTIGIGGMGEVRRVRDPTLDRVVALKVIRNERTSPGEIRRFLAEARLTSQLQHPGIAPVHEVGTLPDGRPDFTLKEIDGVTLRAAIDDVHAASCGGHWVAGPEGWTFRRLIEALRDAAEAVAYAHARGIVHRDLKPDNILLGAFGEVLVVDWGLAKVLGAGTSDALGVPRAAADGLTQFGDIVGTARYCSPEQARGDVARHDRTSDVHALGASLFHMLTGRAPEPASTADACSPSEPRSACRCPSPQDPRLSLGPGHPELPDPLVALCMQALEHHQHARPEDARRFATALGAWLDGSLQRSRALARLPEIDVLLERVSALRAEAASCRRRAAELLAGVAPYDPLSAKQPSWDLEARAARLALEADELHADYARSIHATLELSPGLPEAERRLYDDYRAQLEAAEARHDPAAVARYERLLASDRSGRHAAWVQGDGAVTLVTEPAGATVLLRQYVEGDRQLVLGEPRPLGTTPLREVRVPRGSWLLEIEHPDCATVRYPVSLGRGEHWDGVPPGASEPEGVVLPARGELQPGDCFVPAGWFAAGGDELAPDGLPARRLWVPAFVVREHPVTHQEYVDFLNDLCARGDAELALRCAPWDPGTDDIVYARDGEGRFLPRATSDGTAWEPDWPVVLVDAAGAEAYAAWWAAQKGRPWTLPHDHEWEKAARGVDGRPFPWGRYLDPTFTCMVNSHRGTPTRASVRAYPADRSPYGVCGLGGNVRDLCGNGYRRSGLDPSLQGVPPVRRAPDDEFCMVRGGSWTSVETWCRAAARFTARPGDRFTSVGFRLSYRWSPVP